MSKQSESSRVKQSKAIGQKRITDAFAQLLADEKRQAKDPKQRKMHADPVWQRLMRHAANKPFDPLKWGGLYEAALKLMARHGIKPRPTPGKLRVNPWLTPASEWNATPNRKPLGKLPGLLYEKLLTLPEHKAMTMPQILDWFSKAHHEFPNDDRVYKEILPPLEPYGLLNRPRIGYYIPKSAHATK